MPSYAAVLRPPHARRTFGAALIGRLSYGMVSLSLVLAVKDASGSFTLAGTAMALFGATSVCLSPARAALVDRYGPRRALVPMAGGYAVLLLVLAAATRRPGTPPPLIAALAAAAGAGTPPLGPTMRTLWRRLVPGRELLQRAYSLDGVAEELLYVAGPLLVGALVTCASPSAGVAVSALLVLAGTLALVTSPVAAGPYQENPGSPPGSPPCDTGPVGVRSRWPRQPVVVAAGVGLALGGLDLLVVADAGRHGRPDAVAWVLAALSASSVVGGLVNGAVSWRAPARLRLALSAAGLGLTLTGAGLAPDLRVLAAAAALAGLFVAPALTTAYLIADESAGPSARTRAGAWVNTAVNAGSTGGTAAVGVLVGRVPLALCFALAAAPALFSAASVLPVLPVLVRISGLRRSGATRRPRRSCGSGGSRAGRGPLP
ncbi:MULTISPECIES: MFS transporter [unclassified Streptomyces]|uniref:MFS transporter n=1 Tax=unclassified Streptomyces TaxID=2593676 RepID=UPI002E0EEDC9|nr:MFS transporter [Streptomyces sp. NBC_01197]WSS51741.1 MFS transporter [Streptomyces sp. NBC_01180]